MDKKQIGNIWFDETRTYEPVLAGVFEGDADEAPQLYLTIPLQVFSGVIQHEFCTWITAEGLEHLEALLVKIKKRTEHLITELLIEESHP